jgi:transcriptional regulator with XRE-family HTH domain
LSAALRGRRERAGLSTFELAERLGWSQSKVSKLETGRTRPAPADVAAWAKTCQADDATIDALVDLAEDVATETASWRALYGSAGGAAGRQATYKDLNDQALHIAIYQPAIVPGLVQTAEYARRVFELHGVPLPQVAAAAAARIERQAVLYDQSKTIELIIAEAALRLRVTNPPAHVAQLDKIATMATLPNVSIGIVPWTAPAAALPLSPMVIRDLPGGERSVTIETATTELTITGADADHCHELLARHRATAVFGPECAAQLRRIRTALTATEDL